MSKTYFMFDVIKRNLREAWAQKRLDYKRGGLTEIVTGASWREIGKVLQTSYSAWRVKIRLKLG